MKHLQQAGTACIVGIMTVASYAQWQEPTDTIPAFYQEPPKDPKTATAVLPSLQLTGDQRKYPYQVATYEKAEELSSILYQLPCYCRCDRAEGHKSLHSCFESGHGSACSTCMREVVYAFEMKKMGKSVVEIRNGIEEGDWKKVNLETQALE